MPICNMYCGKGCLVCSGFEILYLFHLHFLAQTCSPPPIVRFLSKHKVLYFNVNCFFLLFVNKSWFIVHYKCKRKCWTTIMFHWFESSPSASFFLNYCINILLYLYRHMVVNMLCFLFKSNREKKSSSCHVVLCM